MRIYAAVLAFDIHWAGVTTVVVESAVVASTGFFAFDLLLAPLLGLMSEVTSSFNWKTEEIKIC